MSSCHRIVLLLALCLIIGAGEKKVSAAERDAEKRADALIEEVFEAMANGQAWLRQRIALAERA